MGVKKIQSGFRIRTTVEEALFCSSTFSSVADPGSGAFLTTGSGMGKKSGSRSRIRIRDEKPGSYFRELRKHFLVKILQFFDVDRGSGMEKIRIRDPGWKKIGSVIRSRIRNTGFLFFFVL